MKIRIENATIVNEGKRFNGTLTLEDDKILGIIPEDDSLHSIPQADQVVDATGMFLSVKMAEKPLSAACRDVRPDRVPRDTEHAAPAPMPYLPHITYKKPTGTCYCPAGPYGYCQYGYIGLPASASAVIGGVSLPI